MKIKPREQRCFKRKPIILMCSRGHVYTLNSREYVIPKGKCPMEMSYDRMNVPATTYCQRTLQVRLYNGELVIYKSKEGSHTVLAFKTNWNISRVYILDRGKDKWVSPKNLYWLPDNEYDFYGNKVLPEIDS